MRKLASVQKILDIQPIDGADAIEVATVNSWKVVIAKKDEFKVGQFVCYFEIDSFIPTAIAPFLTRPGHYSKNYNGVEGERLRTVKLRGCVSQGLVLPLLLAYKAKTEQLGERLGAFWAPEEGEDLTELLAIQKYEPPLSANLAGVARGNFPTCIPKTDEERIQNLTKNWSRLSEFEYEVTEKLEGSSMTVGFVENEFVVCSRNLNLKETEGNTFWGLARKHFLEEKMRNFSRTHLAIQGECVGEGVQGNHYKLTGHHFYVFSMFDIEKQEYISPMDRQEICTQLGLKHAPVLHTISFKGLTIDEALVLADGKSKLNPVVNREGIVLKNSNGQEHFKIVSNAYLLKEKD